MKRTASGSAGSAVASAGTPEISQRPRGGVRARFRGLKAISSPGETTCGRRSTGPSESSVSTGGSTSTPADSANSREPFPQSSRSTDAGTPSAGTARAMATGSSSPTGGPTRVISPFFLVISQPGGSRAPEVRFVVRGGSAMRTSSTAVPPIVLGVANRSCVSPCSSGRLARTTPPIEPPAPVRLDTLVELVVVAVFAPTTTGGRAFLQGTSVLCRALAGLENRTLPSTNRWR